MSVSQLLVPFKIKTSDLLNDFLNGLPKEKIELGCFFRQFQERSYAGIFFILAVLCLLPGVSILAGVMLVFPSVQLLLGFHMPVFPKIIDQQQVKVKRLKSVGKWIIPRVQWIEQFVKPRWLLLSSNIVRRFLGVVIFVLAIIVAIPFPLSNYAPAIAILFISIGMFERDGFLISVGLGVSLVAIVGSAAILKLLYSWLIYFFM